MDRAIIASLILIALSVAAAFIAPDSDYWAIARYSALGIGIATLVGLLAYRIWFQKAGENILVKILENVDE